VTVVTRVIVIGITLLAVLAQPAAAAPLLEEGDAAELAQSLADASDEQDICYGWQIDVQDGSGGPSGQEIGSNLGPGRLVSAAAGSCMRTVLLEGVVSYTCDSCEGEDSASIRVTSNVAGAPTEQDLKDLGFKGGDLANDNGDVVLINMVGALPLITASKGIADPVPVEETSTVVPSASDGPTNSPSTPDWLRDSWLALSALLVLVAGGAFWLIRLFNDDRRRRRAAARAADLRKGSGGGITKSLAAREATADPPPDPAA